MNSPTVFAVLALLGACTKRVNFCESDADCKDPGYPFCDVNGEFAESGFAANSCSIKPPNCPLSRCGCVAAATRCDGDQLITCNPDGFSESSILCPVGCSDTAGRCLQLDPSNGLGASLTAAANDMDVVFPPGILIDTDNRTIVDQGSNPIPITSMSVNSGGVPITVFIAKSFVIDNASIVGNSPFAFVASGSITVKGLLDASADVQISKGGGQYHPAACAGTDGASVGNGGGGGGGNATAGGDGGANIVVGSVAPGGTSTIGFAPLAGGCVGGRVPGLPSSSGGGGGAIQLVSGQLISLAEHGLIHVGGGGGTPSAGGGSGGTVVLEAPVVRIDGMTAGIAANGGAGGACGNPGADATPDYVPASAPTCSGQSGGDGATVQIAAGNATKCGLGSCPSGKYGGGGGAIGRVSIATRDGSYASTNNPIMSVSVTESMLAVH